ncbi:carboxypeptidase-like regulatory domain-containing protein [Candidatus Latescibacterota bacterium]
MDKILIYFLVLIITIMTGCDRQGGTITGDTDNVSVTVSGKVAFSTGTGISDVYVNLSGRTNTGSNDIYINRSVPTNDKGTFSFDGIRNGAYTITPAKTGFVFTPESKSLTVNGANLSAGTFTGTRVSDEGTVGTDKYTVSGSIVDDSGNGLAMVSVGLSGDGLAQNAVTGSEGIYTFRDIPNGTYIVAPGKEGYSFYPTNRRVMVRGGNVTVESITANISEDTGDDFGFAGTHEDYPVSAHASWTISRVMSDFTNASRQEYSYTVTVMETVLINGERYWVLENDDGEFDSYLRIDGDTVYTFAEFAQVTTEKARPARELESSDNDPLTDPLPLLRLDLQPGTTYDIMSHSGSIYGGGSFTHTWLGTYIGTETVTVPAGTFTDCRKYEIINDSAAVAGAAAVREITTSQLWLAPNVGVVKQIDTTTDGYDTTRIIEEELVGYSIP